MSCFICDHLDFVRYISFYRNDDVAESLLQQTIDNLDLIENNLDSLNVEVCNKSSLYQYLWLSSVKIAIQRSERILTIQDQSILKRLKEFEKSITLNRKSFVLYINNNYINVFNKRHYTIEKWQQIKESLACRVFECNEGINDGVYKCIEDGLMPVILRIYNDYCKAYYSNSSNKGRFIALLKEMALDKHESNFLEIYDFLLRQSAHGNKTDFEECVEVMCDGAMERYKTWKPTSDLIDDLFALEKLSKYFQLAKNYELFRSYDLLKKKNEMEKDIYPRLKDYWLKFHNYPNTAGLIDILNRDKNIYKFFGFTQVMDKERNVMSVCQLVLKTENRDRKVSDKWSYVFHASDKYSVAQQFYMYSVSLIMTSYLMSVLSDEKLYPQFLSFIDFVTNDIQKTYFHFDLGLGEEVKGACMMLKNIIESKTVNKENEPFKKALINGCCTNLCGTIEKLVRNIYLREKNKDDKQPFEDPDHLTLRYCLQNRKLSVLSDGLKYYLEYYLCKEFNSKKTYEEKPGEDIRNIQMHNRNGKYEEADVDQVLKLFFLTMTLVNELCMETTKSKRLLNYFRNVKES